MDSRLLTGEGGPGLLLHWAVCRQPDKPALAARVPHHSPGRPAVQIHKQKIIQLLMDFLLTITIFLVEIVHAVPTVLYNCQNAGDMTGRSKSDLYNFTKKIG